MNMTEPRADKFRFAAFAAILILFAVFAYSVRAFYIDDAYITGRYALNLINGSGLVFNPGDVPYEAYSNFLL